MASIRIRKQMHIEVAIRRFRKEVERDNILRELKERQYYIKPAKKRKIEAVKLKKRLKRKRKRYYSYT